MALTLQNAKTMIGISDNSRDNQIKLLIPIIEDEIRSFCNYKSTDTLTPSLEGTAYDMIEYRLLNQMGLQSKSVGDASENYLENYPEYVLQNLRRHKKAKFI